MRRVHTILLEQQPLSIPAVMELPPESLSGERHPAPERSAFV